MLLKIIGCVKGNNKQKENQKEETERINRKKKRGSRFGPPAETGASSASCFGCESAKIIVLRDI